MTRTTDVEEYLDTFENYMRKAEYPPRAWAGKLQPLLNDNCRTVLLQLSAEQRDSYETVKEELQDSCSTRHARVGYEFWTLE